MSKLKVAVIGCGSISHCHFPVYKAREDVELVACVDIDIKRAKACAEKYGVPNYFKSTKEMLEK